MYIHERSEQARGPGDRCKAANNTLCWCANQQLCKKGAGKGGCVLVC